MIPGEVLQGGVDASAAACCSPASLRCLASRMRSLTRAYQSNASCAGPASGH